MKTYSHLYPAICSFENFLAAARKAQKGKRFQENVGQFNANLEHELVQLQRELLDKSYTPGRFRTFTVFEPKKRMISAAPYRDRVVHHALCNIIEPLFEKKFIFDSYANRGGKGSHKAILRYQTFCRKNIYILKCDIKKYFPSIDHQILKAEIRRTIACRDTLWLIDRIIDYSNEQEFILDYFPGDDLLTPLQKRKGLPIGNLTSHFFANAYLNRLDHFVKENLKCKFYLRYMDDFIILGNDTKRLWALKTKIEDYLLRWRLRMHENKCQVYKTEKGLSFLGFRVFPEFRLIKRQNVVRTRRRIRRLQEKYAAHEIGLADVTRSIHGWLGHAKFGDTYRLRQKLFEEFPFVRTN